VVALAADELMRAASDELALRKAPAPPGTAPANPAPGAPGAAGSDPSSAAGPDDRARARGGRKTLAIGLAASAQAATHQKRSRR